MPSFRFNIHADREKLEELCCLFVLGDLSQDERMALDQHLSGCQECRNLIQDFERIMLFELPAAAILQSKNIDPVATAPIDEARLLATVRERAVSILERTSSALHAGDGIESPCTRPWWKRAVQGRAVFVPASGWALAAGLLLLTVSLALQKQNQVAASKAGARSVQSGLIASEQRARMFESEKEALAKQLGASEVEARSKALAYSRLDARLQEAENAYGALESEAATTRSELAQRTAELQLTRNSLNEEVAGQNALQVRLSDAYSRLEKQASEVARLERVAASVPARYPAAERDLSDGDAKEILGARDLHIVDVYDVDHAGKPSQAFGRVYYIDHKELILYAFDLSKLEQNHKAVAFQAWGFREPQSSSVESLGLFYLDNATLNRWTLRVADPQILSRIDTLFVTVEPPGGSPFPKGRRLMMASLAGPPNHP